MGQNLREGAESAKGLKRRRRTREGAEPAKEQKAVRGRTREGADCERAGRQI